MKIIKILILTLLASSFGTSIYCALYTVTNHDTDPLRVNIEVVSTGFLPKKKLLTDNVEPQKSIQLDARGGWRVAAVWVSKIGENNVEYILPLTNANNSDHNKRIFHGLQGSTGDLTFIFTKKDNLWDFTSFTTAQKK